MLTATRSVPALALGVALCLTSLNLPAQPGHTAGLAALNDVPGLIAILRLAEAPAELKARACQQLALVGRAEAVVPLAALLGDPTLSHYARTALEEIPDPVAGDALRSALGSLKGPLLAGVVNSLGVRRDPAAVAPLIPLARNPASGAAAEALVALGRIGTPEVQDVLLQALKAGPAELRPAAADACLRLAESRLRSGTPATAQPLYDAVRETEVSRSLRLAGLRGAILSRGPEGATLLLEQLRSEDLARRNLGLRVARELPGNPVALALAAELPKLPPATQALLVRALADRGDRGVRGAIESLANAPVPEVRLASLEALGVIGADSSVPVLLRALAGEVTATEVDAAAASLARLPADTADATLLETLRSAPVASRPRLIALLGQRGATSGVDELFRQAGHTNTLVSRAAFDALALLLKPAELPRLAAALAACRDTEVRDRAERSLYTVCLRIPEVPKRSDPLAAALGGATEPTTRGSLLQVMAMLGDPVACERVGTAVNDASPDVRDTAVRLLAHWSDATAVPVLLRTFRTTTNEVHRGVALQGLVTLAAPGEADPAKPAGPRKRPSAETIAWLREANGAIRNQPGEMRILLSGLGDLNCLEGLQLLQPYLEDPSVKAEAGTALLRAARTLVEPGEKALARSLVEKAIAGSSDNEFRGRAQEVLKGLGN